MNRRRALISAQGSGGLPSAYQQVEWIANPEEGSTPGPVINTGISPSIGTEIECRMQVIRNSYLDYPALFGSYAPKLLVSIRSTTNDLYMTFGNSGEKSASVNLRDAFHEMTVTKSEWTIDGITMASYNATSMETATSTIYIFGRGSDGGGYGKTTGAKCAYFKIADATGLVFDGVPCYRKADGEIGMFDLVSKTFLTNAGTGTFTKGANV